MKWAEALLYFIRRWGGERRREGSHEINMRAGFSQVFPSDVFQEACLPPRDSGIEREGALRAVFHLSGGGGGG